VLGEKEVSQERGRTVVSPTPGGEADNRAKLRVRRAKLTRRISRR